VQASGRHAAGNEEPGGTGLRYGIIGGTLVAILAFVLMSRSGPETSATTPPKPGHEVKVAVSTPDKATEPQVGEITVIQGKVDEPVEGASAAPGAPGQVVSKKLSQEEIAAKIEEMKKSFEESSQYKVSKDLVPPPLSEEVKARIAKAPFFQNLPPEDQEKYLSNIRTLKQELAEHEDDPNAHIALIHGQEQARLWDHAIQTANKAFDRFPESLPVALERGRINGAWGWRKHAEQGFDRALKLDPGNEAAQRGKEWVQKNLIYHPVYQTEYWTTGPGAQNPEGSSTLRR
jgi:hypothetical protein